MNYFSFSFRLFVWQQGLKRCLKISRNHAVAVARACETKILERKNTALRGEEKKQNILLQQNELQEKS